MFRTTISAIVLGLLPIAVLASEFAPAENLVAVCTSCHGTHERTPAGAPIPPLAGEPREDILRRFAEFRAGMRPSTVMHEIAKRYTDEQVTHVAGWFSSQQ